MRSVKEYYDNIGWTKKQGKYVDTLSFTSKVGLKYREAGAKRLREMIGKPELLLDVACGAKPFTADAAKQLCIDFSITAVREAKNNRPDCIFVLADITSLPLKDNSVTDSVSMHTIYHLDKDSQQKAIEELIRVTKKKCYIVYNSGKHATIVNLLTLPAQLWKWSEKRINPNSKNKIYFYAHSYQWLERFGKLYTYRLLNESGIKLLQWFLGFVAKIEIYFPRQAYHPLLIIDKEKG